MMSRLSQLVRRPSNVVLIILNAILLLAFSLHGVQNGLSFILDIFVFLVLISISSIYHLILWLVIRSRDVKDSIRIPLYLLPIIIVAAMLVILPRPPELPNQQSTLVSPSKEYVMKMDMKHNRWIVNISDRDGKRLYRDDDSDFVGHLNVYWIWDDKDRLWLYNSDDGRVYYWAVTPSGWRKNLWEDSNTDTHGKHSTPQLSPPEKLFPDYEKEGHH